MPAAELCPNYCLHGHCHTCNEQVKTLHDSVTEIVNYICDVCTCDPTWTGDKCDTQVSTARVNHPIIYGILLAAMLIGFVLLFLSLVFFHIRHRQANGISLRLFGRRDQGHRPVDHQQLVLNMDSDDDVPYNRVSQVSA